MGPHLRGLNDKTMNLRFRFSIKSLFILTFFVGVVCYLLFQHKYQFPFFYSTNVNTVLLHPEAGEFEFFYTWHGIDVKVASRKLIRDNMQIPILIELSGAERKTLAEAISNENGKFISPASKADFCESLCSQISKATKSKSKSVEIVDIPILENMVFR